jgi:hypothetical protein
MVIIGHLERFLKHQWLIWFILLGINREAHAQIEKSMTVNKLAVEWLEGVRAGHFPSKAAETLAQYPRQAFESALNDDSCKLAFWINVYNAATQALLHQDSAQYKKRQRFFRKKQIQIAGELLSLNDIEHGMLRRSKLWWSMGYLNKWFPGKFEKALRVQRLDFRIHFALNCGAKSCPPIAFYQPANIDKQLALATRIYLKSTVVVNPDAGSVVVPKIFQWFKADFGGKKGIRSLLVNEKLIDANHQLRIRFAPYNWQLEEKPFSDAHSNEL